jgi:hypothetical protein
MPGRGLACLHLLAPVCAMMCFLFYNFCDFYRNSAVIQHLRIFENLKILIYIQTSGPVKELLHCMPDNRNLNALLLY